MRPRITAIFALIILFVTVVATAQGGGAAALTQARAKKAAGDLRGAVTEFERIITAFPTERNVVANALLEMGRTSEFLGQDAKARTFYDRVRMDYPDQRPEAKSAADRLAEIEQRGRPRPPIEIKTPFTDDPLSFAVSPDGRMLVFQSTTIDGKSQLWRQTLEPGAKPEPIAGTEGAGANGQRAGINRSLPFFSADGRSIGFFRNQKLWRVDIGGGMAIELANTPEHNGGTWSASGVILFIGRGAGNNVLERLSVPSGPLSSLPREALNPYQPLFPKFLGDGLHFVFFNSNLSGGGGARLGSTNGPSQALRANAQSVGFVAPNYVLLVVDGRLLAQPLDMQTMQLTGSPIELALEVGVLPILPGLTAVAAAANTDTVAYRKHAIVAKQMVWMNRSGARIGTLGAPDRENPSSARISPNEQSVVFHRSTRGLGSTWIIDTAGGPARQLRDTTLTAAWSPDGRDIAMGTPRPGEVTDLFRQPPGGNGRFFRASSPGQPWDIEDWSKNNVLLARFGGGDLVAVPAGEGPIIPVAVTPAFESAGRFSPDGKWIAYQSNETGRFEVYVQSLPGSISARQRVSLSGGTIPQWGRDGKELYFLAPDNRLMAAPASFKEDQAIEFGFPRPLFETPLRQGAQFEATASGERFLVIEPTEEAPPIYVLSNWTSKK